MSTAAAPPMRQRILDAAETLFYTQGINTVGVDAIAAEAGISKRTLYKHFPSKDLLIAEYLSRRAGLMTRPEGDPLAQILAVFDWQRRWFASGGFRGCPFVNAVAELSGAPDHPALPVAATFKAARKQWFVDRLTELGVADPAGLAEQLVLLVEGAIATSLVRGGDPQAAEAAGGAARVLLRAAGVDLSGCT